MNTRIYVIIESSLAEPPEEGTSLVESGKVDFSQVESGKVDFSQVESGKVDFSQVESGKVDFSQVMETSRETLRYSVDGTKTFVKFEGDTPDFLDGKTQYNHSEIRAILATPEWSTPHDPE